MLPQRICMLIQCSTPLCSVSLISALQTLVGSLHNGPGAYRIGGL
jgi:hypothetical protein